MLKFQNKKIEKLSANIFAFVILSAAFLPFFYVNAQGYTCDPTKGLCNPISATSISGLIRTVLEFAIKLGIPVIALAIIYSGFLFVAARGNEEKLKQAKSALLYTVIGAAVLLGAWSIAQIISETILSL